MKTVFGAIAVLVVVLTTSGVFAGPTSVQPLVVDLSSTSQPTTLAALTCIGLLNRDSNNDTVAGPMYSYFPNNNDDVWLANLGLKMPATFTSLDTLMSMCRVVAKGYIRYNFTAQQIIVPNIITLGAVLDAVPLEDNSPYRTVLGPLVFDALAVFPPKNTTAAHATAYVFDRYANRTWAMAMMNPGYNNNGGSNNSNPPVTGQPDIRFTDYIVKTRLFNFYLNNGCIGGTEEYQVMSRIAASTANVSKWQTPIPVFGYNEAWDVFGGDLFEANTNCVPSHNMGTCASLGFNNLAYFSRASPVTSPIRQNPEPSATFNKSKTYVSFIMGDGDNTAYLKSGRMDMMKQRVAYCAQQKVKGLPCFPLLWSFSSWFLTIAPTMLQWYLEQTYLTSTDYLMFPPSGYLYSYPAMFPEDVANNAVAGLSKRAHLMNASTTVSWDTFNSWTTGLQNFYPKYAGTNINGVFAVNVPFMIPILDFGLEFYKVLGSNTSATDNVIIFRPREWRGTDASQSPPFGQAEYLTPTQMANEINTYPGGTVTHLYLTTDGGFVLNDLFTMVGMLQEHVEVVGPSQLVDMARQRSFPGGKK
eukprot:PhF_6_TR36213/c0_g1_i3/m.52849